MIDKKKYPDMIRFKDIIGIRTKRCKYDKTLNGFAYVLIDKQTCMIPSTNILIIIRDVDRSKQ